ncbi:hypothetical protein Tco_0730161 [Tanacetum coccineum]|uniref:Movement protein n=1 Tax=Tanacetum coccineum TaxID=301880 RepID=A0ABQ4YRF5_9ASTR
MAPYKDCFRFTSSNIKITDLAQAAGTQSSFDEVYEFMATPIDFSAFMINRLKIDHLTQELLTGPTYDLIKGSLRLSSQDSVKFCSYIHLEVITVQSTETMESNKTRGVGARVMISVIEKAQRSKVDGSLEKFVGGTQITCISIRLFALEELVDIGKGGKLRAVISFTIEDGNLLEPTFKQAPWSILTDSKMVVKNFKKDATLKLSKSINQERYEHVGQDVKRSQDIKVTRWQNKIMLG